MCICVCVCVRAGAARGSEARTVRDYGPLLQALRMRKQSAAVVVVVVVTTLQRLR